MDRSEFEQVLARDWRPVEFAPGERPAFLSSIPDAKVVAMFGSASLAEPNPRADGNPDRGQVGGIDVYRVAEAQDGVALNKDWYAVFVDPDNQDRLLVLGPKRDKEHWIDEIPERLKVAFADPQSRPIGS